MLLVEDDLRLADMLKEYLGQRDFSVTHAMTLAAARANLLKDGADIIVLDLMLPDGDGIDFCREVRTGSQVPIVMLTARGDEMDKVVGLEIGADDYLAKPFDPRELVARLRAVMRRAGQARAGAGEKLFFGDVALDLGAMEVYRKGSKLDITSRQFAILRELALRAGKVVSRDALMEAVSAAPLEAFDRSMDVHISRIRAAIEDDPKKPSYIKTVRGEGYMFTGGQRPEGEGS